MMMYQKQESSLKLISQIGRDLMKMADDGEGLECWEERHQHVRLFAERLYGDSEEAMMLSAAMTLNKR